jgi:hypothetical protein
MFASPLTVKLNAARTTRSAPIAPLSTRSFRRAVCGLCRYMNASIRSRPARSAVSNARSTSSGRRLSGFSQRTCFPASNARIDHSTWSELGSEI